MADAYDVEVTVVSQQGVCAEGHKVGDKWVICSKTPEGMCLSAFHTVFPSLRVLRHGGSYSWEDDPDKTTLVCIDSQNPVIFELKRLK